MTKMYSEAWYKAQDKKRAKEAAAALAASLKKHPLPDGVTESDFAWPDYTKAATLDDPAPDQYGYKNGIKEFELWYVTNFGWCIPTLLISKNTRGNGYCDRTYAVRLDSTSLVRIGKGPHVLATHKVYVTKANKDRLAKHFLAAIQTGQQEAHETRDIISTRRARGAMRRRLW
jgi:hypothetical protein